MNKSKINYWIDVLAGISFVIVAITGLVLFFKFPSGQGTGSLSLWNLTKFQWTNLHNYSGIILIIIVLLHLILHWRWIVVMTKKHIF